MPKYCCQDCGAIFYSWGQNRICRKCGGKLEPVMEKEEEGEINEKQEP